MAKRGPKPIQIDWNEFDKLCKIQCTLVEIAQWYGVTEDTIEAAVKRAHGIKFSEYYRQKKVRGKKALRRKMFALAMKGNPTMLIWLSKQYMGMGDDPQENDDNADGAVVYDTKFGDETE